MKNKPIAPDVSRALLDRFASCKVLVVGDVMLDDYLWGTVRRICPEAPVPIVESQERTCRPGGAANVAANIAALGATVWLSGVTGADDAGHRLRVALRDAEVEPDQLIASADRPTTSKTRVIAHSQQVLRIDTEQTHPLPARVVELLTAEVERRIPDADALLLCDYAKGVLSSDMSKRLIASARSASVPVVVDPKGNDYTRYRGATVIKPNVHDLEHLFGHAIQNGADLDNAGTRLLEVLDGTAVLVTQGADGMTLFRAGHEPFHQPVVGPRPVFDVTGAGDTVVGVIALALACRAPLIEAVRIANIAANIVVGKLGTAVVHPAELRAALGTFEDSCQIATV